MEISREIIEQIITQILTEKIIDAGHQKTDENKTEASGVLKIKVPGIHVTEEDRLDTGDKCHKVYTHDLFALQESPRLGCGIMEMENTTFDWNLNYDEIDYVIEGTLTIIKNNQTVTATPGELILIPKNSQIKFSVPGKARFLYVTYPADWESK